MCQCLLLPRNLSCWSLLEGHCFPQQGWLQAEGPAALTAPWNGFPHVQNTSAALRAACPAPCRLWADSLAPGQDPSQEKGQEAQGTALVLQETLDTSNSQLQTEAILPLVSSLTSRPHLCHPCTPLKQSGHCSRPG